RRAPPVAPHVAPGQFDILTHVADLLSPISQQIVMELMLATRTKPVATPVLRCKSIRRPRPICAQCHARRLACDAPTPAMLPPVRRHPADRVAANSQSAMPLPAPAP